MSKNGKGHDEKILAKYVPVEQMESDLYQRSSTRRQSIYGPVVEKVLKITKKPLQLDVTPKQRTAILGTLKKLGLLATRKEPR